MQFLYNWQFWIAAAFLLIFIIWLFKGRSEPYPYVGLDRKKYEECYPEEKLNVHGKQPVTSQASKKHVSHKLELSASDRESLSEQSPHLVLSCRDSVPVLDDNTGPQRKRKKVDLTPQLPKGIHASDFERADRGSLGERECRKVMEKIYGVPFPNVRPSWLINDKTGRRLELDCYNEDLKLAVEYNGAQHYISDHYYNKSYEQFVEQVYRDELKVDLCDEHGVYLITVPYNVEVKDIESYIRYYLPEAVLARMERQDQ
jgi:hypothetical protein